MFLLYTAQTNKCSLFRYICSLESVCIPSSLYWCWCSWPKAPELSSEIITTGVLGLSGLFVVFGNNICDQIIEAQWTIYHLRAKSHRDCTSRDSTYQHIPQQLLLFSLPLLVTEHENMLKLHTFIPLLSFKNSLLFISFWTCTCLSQYTPVCSCINCIYCDVFILSNTVFLHLLYHRRWKMRIVSELTHLVK